MGTQDVRKVLEATEADDSVRERFGSGDFAAVDGLDLTADEQLLVQDAASDMPEVSGFAADAFIRFDGVERESTHQDHKGEIEGLVVADLSARFATTVARVPALNPHLRSRFSVMQMDVANGLRPGSFDLVTVNAPWVPETVGPDGGPPRQFAAGGPMGFELPRRFIDAATAGRHVVVDLRRST